MILLTKKETILICRAFGKHPLYAFGIILLYGCIYAFIALTVVLIMSYASVRGVFKRLPIKTWGDFLGEGTTRIDRFFSARFEHIGNRRQAWEMKIEDMFL